MANDFADRDGWIWVDGDIVPWRDAKCHVLNHTMHYASGIFEGIRAYNGKSFKLDEHLVRLAESARLLGYALPHSLEVLRAATQTVLEANGPVTPISGPSPGAVRSKCRFPHPLPAFMLPSLHGRCRPIFRKTVRRQASNSLCLPGRGKLQPWRHFRPKPPDFTWPAHS